jgi:cholesterol transport system auxiliary component
LPRAISPRAVALLAPLLAAPLGGCASMVAGAPNAIFDLSAPGEPSPQTGNTQFLVPEPKTVRALDTDRIAARPSPVQYAYLPGAVWSDRLPKLLQARLVETLQNSGRVGAASVPGQGVLINFQMILDVRAFEFTEEGAVAEFAVQILDDRNGQVIRSRVFREVVPVSSTQNAMVVWALDQAMDKAFLQILRWTLP